MIVRFSDKTCGLLDFLSVGDILQANTTVINSLVGKSDIARMGYMQKSNGTFSSNGESPLTIGMVKEQVIGALAQVLATNASDLEYEIGGSLSEFRIDSKQAEVVVAILEGEFGCELPGPAELRCNQYSTVDALALVVMHKVAEHSD
jgi:acyl carrier protein